MKDYLVSCKYETYCQGWERSSGDFLVRAESFRDACVKIMDHMKNNQYMINPEGFENRTIE